MFISIFDLTTNAFKNYTAGLFCVVWLLERFDIWSDDLLMSSYCHLTGQREMVE